ncbi:MAG: 50S ribosomal protein L15 [Lentisphaerae bacterium]|nr:50S ribosomal protein L15 [Lentisphaerota bacterium]
MDLHSLKNAAGSRHRRKRVGRGMGSGHGKTAGKGHKGQMARKGHKGKLGFEGGQIPLIRRIPKRGFKNPVRIEFYPVNVGALECFEDGTVVTPALMRSARLVNGRGGIKVLGAGDLGRKLTVHADSFSQQARAKIEAAGGICETARS